MQAKDVMTTRAATIGAGARIQEAARRMFERGVSALPVVDVKGRVVGIISEGDLVRRAEIGTDQARSWWLRLFALQGETAAADFAKTHGNRVGDVMTTQVISVAEATPLEKVAQLLEKHRIKRVPVMRAGRLVGIVSRADLVRRISIARPARAATPRSDRGLRSAMLKSIAASGLDASYLNVQVAGGVLHLWGGVKSDAEKRALRVAAEGVAGLKRIDDHTFVLPMRLQTSLGAQ